MEKQIQRWLEKGIITKEIALSLLTDVKMQKEKIHRTKMNITIYTIAAILIGTGALTFIAANDWILKLFELFKTLKIFILAFCSCLSLWGGYKLIYELEKYPKLGHFLTILSSILIGGTYALIG